MRFLFVLLCLPFLVVSLAASAAAAAAATVATGQESNKNDSFGDKISTSDDVCDRLENLPAECSCREGLLSKKSVVIECVKVFNGTRFNDTIGIALKMEPCDPAGSSISLDITDTIYHVDFPISQVRAGERQILPIPGLSAIVPGVGHAGIDAVVLIAGNPDELQLQVGLDACVQVRDRFVCAESLPGLGGAFPWWILHGTYRFGDYCESSNNATATTSRKERKVGTTTATTRRQRFLRSLE
jgi:hypothetical protein